MLTSLGIGEALITALNEKGIPTPLVATMLRAPMSRMDILSDSEIHDINNKSRLVKKYSELIDRESAYEMLNKKIAIIENEEAVAAQEADNEKAKSKTNERATVRTSTASSNISKSVIKVLTSATFIRGVFGVLTKIFKK